jgi:hypothetical protein
VAESCEQAIQSRNCGHIHSIGENPDGIRAKFADSNAISRNDHCRQFDENAAEHAIASTNHEPSPYNLCCIGAKGLDVLQRLVALYPIPLSWRFGGTGTAHNR